jgi:undecaprenyl-diphosphatase
VVTLIEAIFLGIVQGLTEWRPISSSGHLVIMQQLFGIEAPLLFDIMLHLGTVLAVIIFFRKEIMKATDAIVRWDVYAGGRFVSYIILGTIPVAVFGFFFYDMVAATFGRLYDVGMMMILMGFILYNTRFAKGERKLGMKDATFVGVAQAAALLPGISRSGTTISMALMRKIRKEQAFAFSFILAIPVIMGASALALYRANLTHYIITADMWVGFVVAGVVGYMSLDVLRQFVMKRRLYKFAFYCWVVGILVIFASFL